MTPQVIFIISLKLKLKIVKFLKSQQPKVRFLITVISSIASL